MIIGDHEIKIVNFADNSTTFLRDIACLNSDFKSDFKVIWKRKDQLTQWESSWNLIQLSFRGKKMIINQIQLSKPRYREQICAIPKYIKTKFKNKYTTSSEANEYFVIQSLYTWLYLTNNNFPAPFV